MRQCAVLTAIAITTLVLGCEGDAGAAGSSCTVDEDTATGMVTITCDDGTTATVPPGSTCTVTEDAGAGTTTVTCDGSGGTISDGTPGTDGTSCTVSEAADGTKTISCDDGTSVVITDGEDGTGVATTGTLVTEAAASAPAAGDFFAAGEQIVLTFTLTDSAGGPLTLDDLSRANLYMYGPNDVRTAEAAVALLNTTADRTANPHHYVNLKTTTNPNLVVTDNVIEYTLEAITDEAPGTYTAGLWAAREGDNLDQVFAMVDVQILSATVQAQIVGNCGDCHEGTNGVTYLHHIDPGYSPTGNPALDGEPVRVCKNCHNNEGYAAYQTCSDGTRPPCSGSAVLERVPDTIVRRVHGVHNGNNLGSAFNIDPDNGDFAHYTHAIFPADVRNCQKCHLDDSWKTQPSRLACGSCHDRLDFSTGTIDPPTIGASCGTGLPACRSGWTCNTGGKCELSSHPAGATPDDTGCAGCHRADETGMSPISVMHGIPAPAFSYDVTITMSAPLAGTHYVDESPTITIAVTNASTGAAVDPATITDTAFGRVNLYVSGPRANGHPVLTTAAEGVAQLRAQVSSAVAPFDLGAASSLSLMVDGTAITVPVSSGTFASSAAATGPEIAAWLNGDTSFAAKATASSVTSRGTTRVYIKSKSRGTGSEVEVLSSDAATALGLAVGVYVPVETHSYANNDLRIPSDSFDADPRITRTATEIVYQLDSVADLPAGTYSIWVEVGAAPPMSWALETFEVGRDTPEPRVATNCVDCHEDTRMHAGYFAINFDPDICRSCHDYERQRTGSTWSSNNMGYGAGPLARRIHGVHFGHYLDKPEEVHATYDYSGVIFPQDVRNCETCHSESNSWAENPSRLACLACHDSDAAIGHGALMTLDPTPADPYSGDETETCATCHGAGRDLAPDVVHDVMTPYQPPYPR